MHLNVVGSESISVLVFVFTKEGANMLIDIHQHVRTDVVRFTKFSDLIKGHRRGRKVMRCS